VTTSSSPAAATINGHDLLRSLGQTIEGPVLWGRPVPSKLPGVFLVELPAPQPKVAIDPNAIREWLGRVPDLRLDGKRPSVAELQSRLASYWLPNQSILYVGSSTQGVAARLNGMYKTPLGERRPQPAGYWLKTLHDLAKARIWWVETRDPELYEDSLLDEFHSKAGALPYAVLVTPAGERRQHGLTNPLHDDAPPRPTPKPTRVTVLPDATEEQMLAQEEPAARGAARSSAAGAGGGSPASAAKPAPKPAVRKTAKAKLPVVGPSAIVVEKPRRTGAKAAPSATVEQVHLTPEGMLNLETELAELTTQRRPEVIARIKAARELGDLSENADYEAARKEQSFLEGRIQQIEKMLKNASIIESSAEGGAVVLGSTVTVETDRHGEETFTIVGSAEADAAAGKISYTSPIGRALMGRRAGETVRVQVPAGSMDFKITEVR
jgi:transcription elongation factor GreA